MFLEWDFWNTFLKNTFQISEIILWILKSIFKNMLWKFYFITYFWITSILLHKNSVKNNHQTLSTPSFLTSQHHCLIHKLSLDKCATILFKSCHRNVFTAHGSHCTSSVQIQMTRAGCHFENLWGAGNNCLYVIDCVSKGKEQKESNCTSCTYLFLNLHSHS